MKILFHNQGVEVNETEQTEMTEKLSGLEKFVENSEATIIDVYLIDEAASETKNGLDQTVHLSAVLPGGKVFIEETSDTHMQAFAGAYHRFKSQLEERHQRMVDENRS